MPHRFGDADKTWFHGKRIFRTPEGWWFSTREKTNEGPFESFEFAEKMLSEYVERIDVSNEILLSQITHELKSH